MNTPLSDLGELLHDAVDEIEPAEHLGDIRARTATAGRGRRPWLYAAGGVGLATAAAVAAYAVLGSSQPHRAESGPATDPTPSLQMVSAYFVGDTERGPRLFREIDEVSADDPVSAALARIQRPASDPDYTTAWATGSLVDASIVDGAIEVEVGAGTTVAADISTQQVVYTLQVALGRDLPVRFVRDGAVLLDPVRARPQTDVLNQVSISEPSEGSVVHDSFVAGGGANSFEATVGWQLLDDRGTVVKEYSTTAAGTGDRLYPWHTRIDVRGLPDGSYTFVALTDDPTREPPGPDRDTRTIIVR